MMRFFVAVFCVLVSINVNAEETNGGDAHGGEAGHHKHSFGLFVGATRAHGENLETFGFEYAYRIRENWSIGGVVERADRDQDSTLIIAFVHWVPWKGLYLGAGLGRKDPGDERQNTARATLGYEFVLSGGWIVSPQLNADFIENEDNEEVFGLVLGKEF